MDNTNTGYGSLIVNVRTANGAIPVPDAIVTISKKLPGGADGEVVYSRVTGADGATPKLELEAPSRVTADRPSQLKPYSEYRAIVTADGYYAAEAVSIPIFEGITAILPVYLVPVPEFAADGVKNQAFPQLEYYNASSGYSSLQQTSDNAAEENK